MANKNYDEAIMTLLESERYFTIGPYYQVYGFESRFFELEDYLRDNFLTEYAERITRIFLSLMACHEFYIELSDMNKYNWHLYQKYKRPSIDLSEYSLPELGELLKTVLIQGKNHLNLYFIREKILVTIETDFSVVVYTPTDTSFTQLIESLAKHESLFILKYGDGES